MYHATFHEVSFKGVFSTVDITLVGELNDETKTKTKDVIETDEESKKEEKEKREKGEINDSKDRNKGPKKP